MSPQHSPHPPPPPPSMWIHEHIHELHEDAVQIALASLSTMNFDITHLQVHGVTVKQNNSRQGRHYGET